MSKQRSGADRAPFAHLFGRAKPRSAKSEDVTDDDKEKGGKRSEDGGDTTDPEENEDEKKRKLDEEKDEHTGEDGLSETDEEDETNAAGGKGKSKAKGKSEAENMDEEDDDKSKAARKRERARCEAIFLSDFAAGQPHVAAQLAFRTDMTAEQAIGVLQATSHNLASPESDRGTQRQAGGLRQRMGTAPNPEVGPEAGAPPPSGPAAFAAQVIAADKWTRNET